MRNVMQLVYCSHDGETCRICGQDAGSLKLSANQVKCCTKTPTLLAKLCESRANTRQSSLHAAGMVRCVRTSSPQELQDKTKLTVMLKQHARQEP